MSWGLSDDLKELSMAEILERKFVKKRIGEKDFYLKRNTENMYDANNKERESLRILFVDGKEENMRVNDKEKKRYCIFSDFFVPVIIDDQPRLGISPLKDVVKVAFSNISLKPRLLLNATFEGKTAKVNS